MAVVAARQLRSPAFGAAHHPCAANEPLGCRWRYRWLPCSPGSLWSRGSIERCADGAGLCAKLHLQPAAAEAAATRPSTTTAG